MKSQMFILLLLMQIPFYSSLEAQLSKICRKVLLLEKETLSDSAGYVLIEAGQKMVESDSFKAAKEFFNCAEYLALKKKTPCC